MALEETYYAYNPWWEGKKFDSGIPRHGYLAEIDKTFSRKQIDIIIGSRRIGKTTFLKQLIKTSLERNVPAKNILYLALDNPKFVTVPISEHLRLFRTIFMHSRDEKLYLFLDEVHESPNWEAELKAIYDLENLKIVCTGSTSRLLNQQGGKLTGRQIITTIYPLTFKEYLTFRNDTPSRSEDYKYERLLEEYLVTGGYPENVLEPSEDYMINLIDDIIARDIIRLHRINRPDLLKNLLVLLAGAVGSRTSFNKISKTLGITVDTVKEYVGYFEEAFLIKTLSKWSQSDTEKIYAQKKIYLFDTGIKTTLTGKGDKGAKTENITFFHLARKNIPIGYYAESERELDFACLGFQSPQAIEVKYVTELEWHDKRLTGVRLFLRRYPQTKEVIIITKNVDKKIKGDKVAISMIPAWKYLMQDPSPPD